MPADAPIPRCLLLCVRLAFAALSLLAPLAASPDPVARVAFDLPAGDAVSTLRLFATQSGRPLLYSGPAVAGIRTAAVRGTYPAREALDRMVADTGLTVTEDVPSGALAITNPARPPDSPSPSVGPPADAPAPMKKRTTLGALAALLSFSLVSSAEAQSASPGTPPPARPEEVIQLSVFQVQSKRELGYRAASSVTATGIGTKISNIPLYVGVVTKEFIQDWGGVELQDATKGVSGFNSDVLNSNRAWLRGFESSRILQDGFEVGLGMMTDGIDRIEVIKGPSAIFHGEVNPAGVVNLISARPTWHPEHEARFTVGSYEHYRGYLQSSGPLIADKLAYMAFASYTDSKSWDDHTMKRFKIGGAALTWQPTPKLKLTVDARSTDRTEIIPALLPFSHPAFVAAVQAGQVAPLTTARAWLNANPLYGPTEPQSQILVDHLLFKSRSANPANRNNPQYEERRSIQGELVYEHSRAMNFRFAAFANEGNRTAGSYTSFRPIAGFNRNLIFGVAEHRVNYSYNEQERSGFKADFNLNFDFLGANHALLVGYEHGERESGTTSIQTAPAQWNPLVDPERDIMTELRTLNPNWFRPIADFGRLESDSYYVANQMTLFGEKLRVLAGARHMELEVYTPAATAGAGRTNKQAKTTPQVGILLRPSDLGSFYLNYSESFESQLVVDVLGGVTGPITGNGLEAGVKTDWMDGRLSGSLGVYRIERANIARRDFPRERELNISPLWIPGGEQRSEGLDLDLTYSPQRNLQFMLTYAHMWFATTVADQQTPQQVGVRLRHAPEHSVGLFGKYSFVEGPLAGFYAGASVLYRSPFNFHDSWDVPYRIDDYRKLDLLFGYRKRLADGREFSVSLNLDNVTDEEYLDLQFYWADPFTWRLTTSYRF